MKDITVSGRGWTKTFQWRIATGLTETDTIVAPSSSPRFIAEKQETVSEGHPWPPRKGKSNGDIGGPFSTKRQHVLRDENYTEFYGGKRRTFTELNFSGDVVATTDQEGYVKTQIQVPYSLISTTYPSYAGSSGGTLNSMGATAISRCKPDNPAADLAVFLGELKKDGIPALIGSRTWETRAKKFNALGDEYLNVEFGWKPFVKDIRDFLKAVSHADKVLRQYESGAGKRIRRSYRFPEQRTESVVNVGSGFPDLIGLSGLTDIVGASALLRTDTVVRDVWFKGCFTYYLPSGYDSRKKLSRYALFANNILGLNLTPKVIWELAPWSWAVDWFANVGDVLNNVSAVLQDGLVMHYGYVMEHSVSSRTFSMPGTSFKFNKAAKVSPLSLVSETKVRVKANPYGFGVNWNGLSPRQIAILLALGISRS